MAIDHKRNWEGTAGITLVCSQAFERSRFSIKFQVARKGKYFFQLLQCHSEMRSFEKFGMSLAEKKHIDQANILHNERIRLRIHHQRVIVECNGTTIKDCLLVSSEVMQQVQVISAEIRLARITVINLFVRIV